MTHPITTYLNQIRDNLATGAATEHTHRTALANLIESLGENITAVNEPARIACGAPDLAILREGFMVGHVESKDVGVSLDAAESSGQLKRYRLALDNLILTDYLEFRWYVKADLRRTVRLARRDARGDLQPEPDGRGNLQDLLTDFLAHEPQSISSARELAERMARLTHLIRDVIVAAFEHERASQQLLGWRRAFAQVLIPDLDQPEKLGQFADMFAQTLSYGLFSARIMHQSGTFSRYTAQQWIPRTNPFLRNFFAFITGPQLADEPYAGLVEDLIQVLALADLHAILADFGRGSREDDPMMHFYETFLAAYDPNLREQRGVYYTPMPVVSFIVRSVDHLLKTRFNLPRGLADTARLPNGTHKVLVLDPAVGTATFLYAVIDLIREDFMARQDAGMWSGYVRDHLLDRIFGFEIMMAPYAVAHFKLALQLAGYDLDLPDEQREKWTYDFQADDRIQVYLTNALEILDQDVPGLYGPMQFVTEEAKAADAVKQDKPIMVVLGNPPYSGYSSNKGEWIENLLHGELPNGRKTSNYYQINGKSLDEKKIWLKNDYVKFIRFGEWKIESSGYGILAFITDNSYLDNPTFRGMRQSLISSFDEIFILNLHGSSRRGETPPEGITDQNVFDIQQGVSISIFIKNKSQDKTPIIHYHDIWGDRNQKYQKLLNSELPDLEWSSINPETPFYVLGLIDIDSSNEYNNFSKITEIFPNNSVGIQTSRDKISISTSLIDLKDTISKLRSDSVTNKEIRKEYFSSSSSNYPSGDSSFWKLEEARSSIKALKKPNNNIKKYLYRPFDFRYIFYSSLLVHRTRESVMRHLLEPRSLGLIIGRYGKAIGTSEWNIVFCTQFLVDMNIFRRGGGTALPLFIYPEKNSNQLFDLTSTSPWDPDPNNSDRVPNLNPAFVTKLENKLGLRFDSNFSGISTNASKVFGPEDVLAYIYAIFHSPTYRERYAEFLKIDFPRVPITSDAGLFRTLVYKGRELIAMHLMESPKLQDRLTHYPVPGDNTVPPRGGYPKYTPPEEGHRGRVYINREQYFEGVTPEVWEFEIGGYQVLHKWLKDRRGRELSYDERDHYQQIVVALAETMRLMDEIDAAIPNWPIS